MTGLRTHLEQSKGVNVHHISRYIMLNTHTGLQNSWVSSNVPLLAGNRKLDVIEWKDHGLGVTQTRLESSSATYSSATN